MSLPNITQTWTIAPTVRSTYTSLNQVMGDLLYQLKNFLVATMGYTVKYTCDGTTGPSSSSDHTDRWTDATKARTRFNGAGGAQSFAVLTDGDGVDILLTYDGSSDDIALISYSPGAQFTPAGTANQKPTATDECTVVSGVSLIASNTSADRVFWFWASSDKKMFRAAVWRQGTLAVVFGVEKLVSALISPATFALAGGGSAAKRGFFYTAVNNSTGSPVATGSGALGEAVARVHTGAGDANIVLAGGGENGALPNGITTFNVEKPALQGGTGELIFPLQQYCYTANYDGKLGSVIDWWYTITSNNAIPAGGDTFGSLQFVALGASAILPWDGVTTPVTS